MSKSNRILVVVDPTQDYEQTSVSRGRWLAKKLGLGVELLICYYDQTLTGDRFFDTPRLESIRKEVVSRYQQKLEKMADLMKEKGVDTKVSAIWDTPLDEGIIRHVLRSKPEYVVKELHFHDTIQRALFRNTDWNLVRLCPAPLWLAKAHDWPENATILASLDPTHENDEYSELDQQILTQSVRIAEHAKNEIHAFNAYLPLTSVPMMQADPRLTIDDEAGKKLKADHQERLNMQLNNFDVAEKNVHLLQGYPARLLPKLTEDLNTGLLVMGSIARNVFKRVLIGSTAEKVLSKVNCDLLVLKPDWFVTSVEENSKVYFDAAHCG